VFGLFQVQPCSAKTKSILLVTTNDNYSFGQEYLLGPLSGVNATIVINPSNPILSDYDVVIGDGWMWNSSMIDQLRIYVDGGGSLMLTAGTPFFIAGGTDLSSIKDLIGVTEYENTFSGDFVLSVDNPYCLPFMAHQIIGSIGGGSWAHVSGAVDSLTNKVFWSDGTLASYAYVAAGGKYFYIAACGPGSKMASLVTAAVKWMLGDNTKGDVDGSGSIDIADAVHLIAYMFSGGPEPIVKACDVNCDNKFNIADVVYLVRFIFSYGEKPCGCL
jgi:hypothetical protein